MTQPTVAILSEPGSESHELARAVESALSAAGAELAVRHQAGGLRDMFGAATAPPDCIVAIDPGGLVGMQPGVARGQTLVVAVVPDLVVPSAWERVPAPHAALVAHKDLVRPFAALGVPEAAVVATGVPVPPTHAPVSDVASERAALQVGSSRVVFVAGRGLGVGRIDRLLVQLGILAPDLELFVDVEDGDVGILAQRMKLLGVRARRLRDVGMTGRITSIADVVVGAPSPLQVLAALAAGRPVLVAEPRGAEEIGRAAFLEAHGAGGALVGSAVATARLRALFEDPGARERASTAARRLVVPDAGRNVALALDGLIRNRQRLIGYAKEAGKVRARVEEAVPGGLEDIGAAAEEVTAARDRAVDRAIRELNVDRELQELKRRLTQE
ncbi:MAG: hypothetical protein AMXMBFR64_11130 [Myxococcales bacterium]